MYKLEHQLKDYQKYVQDARIWISNLKRQRAEHYRRKNNNMCARCCDYSDGGCVINDKYRCFGCTIHLQASGMLPFSL